MAAKKHLVTLDEAARERAERAARSHKRPGRERVRARILLLADTGRAEGALSERAIAAQTGVGALTVQRVRQRCARGGLERALCHGVQKKRKARRLDGRAEAHLVALSCGAPPAGHQRWSLHLLAGKLVELRVVDSVSHERVRQTLKKMRSSPG